MGRRRQRRRGSDSHLLLARNKTYGADVDTFDAPSGSDAGFSKNRFVFTRNTLDADIEQLQSESIVGGGDSKNVRGRIGGGGDWEFELLPETLIQLMLGWFNPDELPDNNPDVQAPQISAADITGLKKDAPDAVDLSYPSQLTLAGGGLIKGFRRGGKPSDDLFPVQETVAANGKTKNFYTRIRSIADSVTGITADPDTKIVELTLNSLGNQFAGWTSQMAKGVMPVSALRVIPNSFSINVSNTARLVMNVLASRVINNSLITDINDLAYQIPKAVLDTFGREPLNFFPAWGQALTLGNKGETLDALRTRLNSATPPPITTTTDLTVAGTHNYVQPQGNAGTPFAGQPVVEDNAVRQTTFNATIFHETDTSETDNQTILWQQLMVDNATLPAIVRFYNWLDNGRQLMVEIGLREIQLTAVPTLAVESRGQMDRRIAGKSIPESNDEIVMKVWCERGFDESKI